MRCVLADRMCAPIEPTMKGLKDMKPKLPKRTKLRTQSHSR